MVVQQVFNLRTKRFNTLATAKKNGLEQNPRDFAVTGDRVLLKDKSGRLRLFKKQVAHKHIEGNKAILKKYNPRFTYNEETNRIVEAKKVKPTKIIRKEGWTPNAGSVWNPIGKLIDFIFDNKLRGRRYIGVKDGARTTKFGYNLPDWKSKQDLWNWFRDIQEDWLIYVDGELQIRNELKESDVLYSYAPKTVSAKVLKQSFKEGITNCVLTPIMKWCDQKHNDALTQRTKKRYRQIRERLVKLEQQYHDTGIAEDVLQDLANTTDVSIKVYQPFMANPVWSVRPEKKPLSTFNLLNTRFNHVEEMASDKLVLFSDKKGNHTEYISSYKEMNELVEQFKRDNMHYIPKQYQDNISQIMTLDKIYKIRTPYQEAYEAFNAYNEFIFDKIAINHVTDPVSDFVLRGTEFNNFIAYPRFCEEIDLPTDYFTQDNHDPKEYAFHHVGGIKQLDETKCYTQFKSTPGYVGFLGKITDYRMGSFDIDWINKHVGLYELRNIRYPKETNLIKHIQYCKMLVEGCVKPSPEIDYYHKLGIRFDIVRGCWGTMPIHWDYTQDMLEGKTVDENRNGRQTTVKWYSAFVGKCAQLAETNKFSMHGTTELFQSIKHNLEMQGDMDTKIYYNEWGVADIYMKSRSVYHKAQIASFVTSYSRIRLMEALKDMPFDSVLKLVTDGIYHVSDVNEIDLYRSKPVSEKGVMFQSCKSFCKPKLSLDEQWRKDDVGVQEGKYYTTEYHHGAGGTGKTHVNVIDKGNVRACYCSPSWKLAKAKKNEYKGLMVTTIARLLMENYKIDEIDKRYSTLIIDEVSMMTNEKKEQILKMYPYHKIIFCGDVGYQLPPIEEGTIFNKEGLGKIVDHNYVYRFKCELLRELATKLRVNLDNKAGSRKSLALIQEYLEKHYPTHLITDIESEYDIHDMVLASTNKKCDAYTEQLKGKFDVEKFIVTANTSKHSNGEIVICKTEDKPNDSKIAHAFTAHKIQGETADHKLFIDTKFLFQPEHLYTMISRARTLEQIYLIQ